MAKKTYGDQNGRNAPAQASRLGALRAAAGKGEQNQPDWGRIEDRLLWQLIQVATADDGAILFGYSRDGGAYACTLFVGDEKEKLYFHSDAEITEAIINMIEVLRG